MVLVIVYLINNACSTMSSW